MGGIIHLFIQQVFTETNYVSGTGDIMIKTQHSPFTYLVNRLIEHMKYKNHTNTIF